MSYCFAILYIALNVRNQYTNVCQSLTEETSSKKKDSKVSIKNRKENILIAMNNYYALNHIYHINQTYIKQTTMM